MKKTTLTFSLFVATLTANAQTLWDLSGTAVTTTTSGTSTIGSTLYLKGGLLDMATIPDNSWRQISGNSTNAGLRISSGFTSNDGSSIELYGANETVVSGGTRKGLISYSSYGSTGIGHQFLSYVSGTGWLSNMTIHNSGQVGIGRTATGTFTPQPYDVLSVKDQMGFFSDDPTSVRNIHGNAPNGILAFAANTESYNGPTIAMHGPSYTGPSSHPGSVLGREGSIFYNSYGDKGVGHIFINYAPGEPAHTWHSNLAITNNGHVNVGRDVWPGTEQPGDVLTVRDQIGFLANDASLVRKINGNAPSGALFLHANTSSANGGSIEIHGQHYAGREGSIHYGAAGKAYFSHLFTYFDEPSNDWVRTMAISSTGKVIIGKEILTAAPSATPDGYRLYVSKGILTEKLKVANSHDINWADFVFDDEYKLMPLQHVENYIRENKHLPEIPSAKEVTKDGIDVAEMDAKLLQKIEELTLYVIQQQKDIENLKKQIGTPNKQ